MNSSLRILFSVHGYKPAYRIGGPILSVSALAESLVRKGHKVSVFTTNSNLTEDLDVPTDRPIDVDGVEVWYFKREEPLQKWLPFVPYLSKSMGYLYAPKMRSALEEVVPTVDVVHTHLPFVYPTYAAARVAHNCSKPLFYHQRGVFDPERLKFRKLKKRIYLNLIEKPMVLRHVSTLISLTEYETESYRLLGLNTPCEVIPNGIDVEAYWQNLPIEWHTKLGIKPQSTVILFLGRLHPIKGAQRLLQAFLKVHCQFPNTVLVMAGPDEFGIQQSLKSEVKDSTMNSKILFPGMVSGDQKKALLAMADVFCLPSDGEGFSIAVLEAMASRTAVLLSPGCHFDTVEAAGAGKIVPKDSDSVAKALSDLLSDKNRLKKMGMAGLELVKTRYGWDYLVEKLLCVYERGIREGKNK
jgi:glycosyltransferase involved in cell wall biosynthesis